MSRERLEAYAERYFDASKLLIAKMEVYRRATDAPEIIDRRVEVRPFEIQARDAVSRDRAELGVRVALDRVDSRPLDLVGQGERDGAAAGVDLDRAGAPQLLELLLDGCAPLPELVGRVLDADPARQADHAKRSSHCGLDFVAVLNRIHCLQQHQVDHDAVEPHPSDRRAAGEHARAAEVEVKQRAVDVGEEVRHGRLARVLLGPQRAHGPVGEERREDERARREEQPAQEEGEHGRASCRARARASTPRRTSWSDGHIGGTAIVAEPAQHLGDQQVAGRQEPDGLVVVARNEWIERGDD